MATPAKTIQELDRMRAKDAPRIAAERKAFKPEPNVAVPLAYFEVSRYTQGTFTGSFKVVQLITEDRTGKNLKHPIRKVISDGDFYDTAMAKITTAFRKRAYGT